MIEYLNDLWNFIQSFDKTALINAAKKGYIEIVELLLNQENIDVNIKDI